MEIIVHYPEDNQNLNTLGEQIATLHGEFIYSYLNRLDLSTEEKVAIIEGVEKMIKQGKGQSQERGCLFRWEETSFLPLTDRNSHLEAFENFFLSPLWKDRKTQGEDKQKFSPEVPLITKPYYRRNSFENFLDKESLVSRSCHAVKFFFPKPNCCPIDS